MNNKEAIKRLKEVIENCTSGEDAIAWMPSPERFKETI